MKNVSDHTKLTPNKRFQLSKDICQLIADKVKKSGVLIDSENSSIDALLLNPPRLLFTGNSTISP